MGGFLLSTPKDANLNPKSVFPTEKIETAMTGAGVYSNSLVKTAKEGPLVFGLELVQV